MSTDIDWREELDSSFGAGADRPATDYLVPGRAALRRRRTAMGATTFVALIIIGGIGWAISPNDHDTRSNHVATDPGTRVTDVAVRRVDPGDPGAERLATLWAEVNGAGLVAMSGTNILRTVDNPLGFTGPQSSIGVSMTRNGKEQWALLTGSDGQPSGGVWSSPREPKGSFDDWLNDAAALRLDNLARSPVPLNDNGPLPAPANVEILEQVLAPAQAAGYGSVGDSAAVKYLTPQGGTSFALVFKNRDALVVDPTILDAPTMGAFLDHLQDMP